MLNHTIPKEWFKGCLEWSPMKSPIKNGIGETAARGRRWKQVTPREILMFWSKTMLGVYFTSNQQDSTSISYAAKWILMSFMQVKPQNWWSCHYAVTTLVPCHQGIYTIENLRNHLRFCHLLKLESGTWLWGFDHCPQLFSIHTVTIHLQTFEDLAVVSPGKQHLMSYDV